MFLNFRLSFRVIFRQMCAQLSLQGDRLPWKVKCRGRTGGRARGSGDQDGPCEPDSSGGYIDLTYITPC